MVVDEVDIALGVPDGIEVLFGESGF